MSKHIRITFMCVALCALLSGVLLVGCSSESTSTAAPASQQSGQQVQQSDQGQQAPQGQQGQPPAGQPGQGAMQEVIAKAAVILGVDEADLTTAWENAMQELGGGQGAPGGAGGPGGGTPPSGERPEGEPPEGGMPEGEPPEGGQPPAGGGSEMMTEVYTKVAEALGLTAEEVQSAFEQAQSELNQQ